MVAGEWGDLWLYLAEPIVGALVAVGVYETIRGSPHPASTTAPDAQLAAVIEPATERA